MVRVSSNFNYQDQRSVVNFSTHNFADIRFFSSLFVSLLPKKGGIKNISGIKFYVV